MATLELEGPDTGWIATIGFDEQGDVRVLSAREGWEGDALRLLARLLQEPGPSGRPPGEHVEPNDESLLYDLASIVRRRRPEFRNQRLVGYVSGGSRCVETGNADF